LAVGNLFVRHPAPPDHISSKKKIILDARFQNLIWEDIEFRTPVK